MTKKAIILLSGGLDSTTCLAIAQSQGFECHTLTFDYGQRHRVEIERAKQIAEKRGVASHKILRLPLDEIKGSSLTDSTLEILDYTGQAGIPNTYVPARNTIFLSFALAFAEVIGASDIFYGANHLDYSGYPDCRPAYWRAFEALAALATKAGVEGKAIKIQAPLLKMTKADIVKEGIRLGIDYQETISCYRGDLLGRACGACDACVLRKKGFSEAGHIDPTIYI